jgi:predicted RNA-binding Zn-ribbon protein involved in translation (DUF1610 family)
MDDKALCPDCGSEFDPTNPMMIQGDSSFAMKVFKCPKCGHFIYQMVQSDEDNEGDKPAQTDR